MKKHTIKTSCILLSLLALTACGDETKSNPLLQQISPDSAEHEHKVAGLYLVETAEAVQPRINKEFNLNYKVADFYIQCMNDQANDKKACKALYQAMVDKAKVTGHANFLRKQNYENVTVANISSKAMWKILSQDVIDNNCEGVWRCGSRKKNNGH